MNDVIHLCNRVAIQIANRSTFVKIKTHKLKKLIRLTAIFAGCIGLQTAVAPLKVNLNVNIGNQTAWAPSGYDM